MKKSQGRIFQLCFVLVKKYFRYYFTFNYNFICCNFEVFFKKYLNLKDVIFFFRLQGRLGGHENFKLLKKLHIIYLEITTIKICAFFSRYIKGPKPKRNKRTTKSACHDDTINSHWIIQEQITHLNSGFRCTFYSFDPNSCLRQKLAKKLLH